MDPPLPNTYWVIPELILAGEHPSGARAEDTRRRLDILCAAGIDYFIDLTEIGEMPEYRPLLPKHVQYLRCAIRDTKVPREVAHMQELQSRIGNARALGRRMYIHCRAGIGRTSLAVGCFLAEGGLDGPRALEELNLLWRDCARSKTWPVVPQTDEQADYIRAWPQHRKPPAKTPAVKAPAVDRKRSRQP
jgi:atypical dual specificity phosphatase